MVLLVSGGSMATLTGLAVARHVQLKVRLVMDVRTSGLQSVERRIPVHMSTEGHSRSHKAVALLSLGSDNLRVGPEGPAALVRDLGTQLAGRRRGCAVCRRSAGRVQSSLLADDTGAHMKGGRV